MTRGAPIAGIDLGTTNSAIAIWDGAKARLLENAGGEVLTPSAVAEDPDTKSLIVGRSAKDRLARDPSAGAFSFKRLMGEEHKLAVGSRRLRPEEASAYVLDALRADAERQLGTPVSRCVISVPAYFGEAQRVATRKAGELAGWAVERIVNEPTAAALAYGFGVDESERRFVVLDLGGGTFDVCVMERFEGLLEVRGVAGVSQLGGDDFTIALANFCLRRAGSAHTLDTLTPGARTRAFRRAELLKRKLARWPEAEVAIPLVDDTQSPAPTVRVSAAEANDVYAPLLDRLARPCREAMRGASVALDEIDDVLLVGGASQLPAFARLARELFGREPILDPSPDQLVAKGAAIQGALCADEEAAVRDVVVTDVLSHSLGTDVARELGGKVVSGFFAPIVHRNTVIPVSRSELFGTMSPNQRTIELGIYEGESRRVEENTKLGELLVTGIPRGPKGQEIRVTFTYDVSGTLDVEAIVIATGQSVSKTFVRRGGLSREETERAQARIRQLKTDPRDRPRYREALNRAELLWSEGTAAERATLELAITEFESAIEDGKPGPIEEAYATLCETCRRIDHDERW
ncbi:MAG: Hsp70 family protein [Myxococcota bacterium]